MHNALSLGYVRLGEVRTQKELYVAISWVLGFILHIPYVADARARALPSILLKLSLTDMMYRTPEKKQMPVSILG